jgi:hypothetical protein
MPTTTATIGATGQLQPFEINQNPRWRDDFSIIISADRRAADAREPIRIRFTVINYGDDHEIRKAEEGPVLDILVRYNFGSRNFEEWWSEGREIMPEMRTLELGPRESKTIEWTWTAWDEDYMAPIDIYGVFHDEYHETKVQTTICIEEGCGEY